jgi:hypothetical protein
MSESETATETAPKTRKPRGPRAEFTVGDILNLERIGVLEQAKELNGDNASFQAALKAAGSKSAHAAALAGFADGEKVCDFRKGVFVSLAALGAVEGSRAMVQRDGDRVIVTLVA